MTARLWLSEIGSCLARGPRWLVYRKEAPLECSQLLPCFVIAGKGIAPVGPACLQQLAAQLLEVCRNPTQPGFNHYLFESLAALVRWAAGVGNIWTAAAGQLGSRRQQSRLERTGRR